MRWVLAAFVLGRAVVLGAAALAESQSSLVAAPAVSSTGAQMLWTDVPILSSLTSWDGVNYLLLAANGYAGNPANGPFPLSVFFPVYPATIAASRLVGGNGALAAVLISNMAFVVALLVVLQLGRRVVGEEQARRGSMFLALVAGGTAFSMAYTESVFLLVSAGALLAAERGRAGWAGILFGLAAVTRLPGVALGLPLALILWRTRPDRGAAMPWLLLGPATLGAFPAYLGAIGGDPLGPIRGQAVWIAAFAGRLPEVAGPSGPAVIIPILGDPRVVGTAVILLLAVTVVCTLLARRARVTAPYVLLMAIAVLTVLAPGRLVSADRFLAVAFPIGWVIATAARPLQIAWVVFSVAMLAATAYLSFRLLLPP
ncbi:MAG: mannosyltransferase family protein [Chloroflexota bacterium]